jgi:hypothetical protein
MLTRIVLLALIVGLALPVTALTPPAATHSSSWSNAIAVAKGKKHKHHKRKKQKRQRQPGQPQTTQDPITVRQSVTRTFTSTQPITIPNGAPANEKGPSNPYPTTIAVSGFTNGTITDVNLILNDLTHQHYDDLDFLLSAADGRRALVMSDVADAPDVAGEDIDLTLDDEAAAALPGHNEYLRSGTFRPTNLTGFTVDTFDAPAPTPNGNVTLSTFDGADPNGTWQLWVMDNAAGDHGDLGDWSLQITADVDVVTQAQRVPGDHAQQRQHRRFSTSRQH